MNVRIGQRAGALPQTAAARTNQTLIMPLALHIKLWLRRAVSPLPPHAPPSVPGADGLELALLGPGLAEVVLDCAADCAGARPAHGLAGAARRRALAPRLPVPVDVVFSKQLNI